MYFRRYHQRKKNKIFVEEKGKSHLMAQDENTTEIENFAHSMKPVKTQYILRLVLKITDRI